MKQKISAYFFIVVGFLIVILSLGADLLGLGKGGISAAQLLGVQIGFFIMLFGAGLLLVIDKSSFQIKYIRRKISDFFLNQPSITWVLAGFLVIYFFIFIGTVFLNANTQFEYFYRYLPDNARLGLDLRTIVKYINIWLLEGKSPYFDQTIFYPPLYNFFLAPLILLEYPGSYYFITGLSLVSFCALTLVIPALLSREKTIAITAFFFLTGIFSYGLQFELERGQYNIITFFLCLLSIAVYHRYEKFRYFAYLLFSISVQLKTFPLIFIIMFTKDWRDWKNNILRLAGLGLFNFALLFGLGYSIFVDFVNSTVTQIMSDGFYTWIGNHSIKAFVFNLANDGLGVFSGPVLEWMQKNNDIIQAILLTYFVVGLLSIIVIAYKRNQQGFNANLLLACTIVGMTVPSVSHDYKLALLAAPLSVALSSFSKPATHWGKILAALILFLASLAYSITLYPFKYRPYFLANSLPALFVLMAVAILAELVKPSASSES